MTCDEELVRKMNAIRSPYRKSKWYQAFKFDADHENVISEIDDNKHNSMRSTRAPGVCEMACHCFAEGFADSLVSQYSGRDNAHLETSVDEVIFSMIRLLDRKYISDESQYRPVDLGVLIQYFTLDIITSLSLSHSFGYLETDSDVYGYIKTMEDNFPAMVFMSVVPMLSFLLRQHWFQKLSLPSVKDRVGMGKVKRYVTEIILCNLVPNHGTVYPVR